MAQAHGCRIVSARIGVVLSFIAAAATALVSLLVDSDPSFGHHGQHALHKLGLLVDAPWLQKVLYLGGEFVDRRVAGRQLAEGEAERSPRVSG